MNKSTAGSLSYNPLSANRWKLVRKEVKEIKEINRVKYDLKHIPAGSNTLIWFYQICGLSFFGYNRDPILKVTTLFSRALFLAVVIIVYIPCLLNCRDNIFNIELSRITTRFVRSLVDYCNVLSSFILTIIAFRWGGKLRVLLGQIQNLRSRFGRNSHDNALNATSYALIIITVTSSLLIGANVWFNDEERIVHQDQTEEEEEKSLTERQRYQFSQKMFKRISVAVMTILLMQHSITDGLIIYLNQLLHSLIKPFQSHHTALRMQQSMISQRILAEQQMKFKELDSILLKMSSFMSVIIFCKILLDGVATLLDITIIVYILKTFNILDSAIWVEVCRVAKFSINLIIIMILRSKANNCLEELRLYAENFNAFLVLLPASHHKVFN